MTSSLLTPTTPSADTVEQRVEAYNFTLSFTQYPLPTSWPNLLTTSGDRIALLASNLLIRSDAIRALLQVIATRTRLDYTRANVLILVLSTSTVSRQLPLKVFGPPFLPARSFHAVRYISTSTAISSRPQARQLNARLMGLPNSEAPRISWPDNNLVSSFQIATWLISSTRLLTCTAEFDS